MNFLGYPIGEWSILIGILGTLFGFIFKFVGKRVKEFTNKVIDEFKKETQANLTTDENVALALAEGVPVTVWSADGVDRKHLIEIGITGISTDFANIQQELLVD